MKFIHLLICIFFVQIGFAQSTVSRIYTDFNGWWDSGNSGGVIPNNTHNLLGFQINGLNFTTNVDDNKVIVHGVTNLFQIEYKAMPVSSNITPQYIGVGTNYGGAGNISPAIIDFTNSSQYLTDGMNGLDLGTALFNSSGSASYHVPYIDPNSIGDGIPDIIVTQMGDPSVTTDKFSFRDINNQTVGNVNSITFTNISSLGKFSWKFFRPADQTYVASLAGTRDVRIIGYDFSDFGITAANYQDIDNFYQQLSGSSDQGFIAYNSQAISLLPIELIEFKANLVGANVELTWKTASEKNNDYFTIEKSQDGKTWIEVATARGKGNSVEINTYHSVDYSPFQGISYYRLSQTDFDGVKNLASTVVSVHNTSSMNDFMIYPNPAKEEIRLSGIEFESYQIFDTNGKNVSDLTYKTKNNSINTSGLKSGVYFVVIKDKVQKIILL